MSTPRNKDFNVPRTLTIECKFACHDRKTKDSSSEMLLEDDRRVVYIAEGTTPKRSTRRHSQRSVCRLVLRFRGRCLRAIQPNGHEPAS